MKGVQFLEIEIDSGSTEICMDAPGYNLARRPDIRSIFPPKLWVDIWEAPFERSVTRTDSLKEVVAIQNLSP